MRYRFNRSSIDQTIQMFSWTEEYEVCTTYMDEDKLSTLCNEMLTRWNQVQCKNYPIEKSVQVYVENDYYVDTRIKNFRIAKGSNYVHLIFDVSLPSSVDYTEFYIKLDNSGKLTQCYNTSVCEVSGGWEFEIDFVAAPQVYIDWSSNVFTTEDRYTKQLDFFEGYALTVN